MGLVASTGGPEALVKLLGALPAGFPMPILLVQHITSSFLNGFVHWLDDLCPLPVGVARDGEMPAAGRVYSGARGPSPRHRERPAPAFLEARAPRSARNGPRGSVYMFRVARRGDQGPRDGGRASWTGMGEDGADGMRDVRAAGGYTIAEDESTAVVYGMPAAAVRLDAVCESLPLPAIAPRLLELVAPARGGG